MIVLLGAGIGKLSIFSSNRRHELFEIANLSRTGVRVRVFFLLRHLNVGGIVSRDDKIGPKNVVKCFPGQKTL
jgi:hypothetical protein